MTSLFFFKTVWPKIIQVKFFTRCDVVPTCSHYTYEHISIIYIGSGNLLGIKYIYVIIYIANDTLKMILVCVYHDIGIRNHILTTSELAKVLYEGVSTISSSLELTTTVETQVNPASLFHVIVSFWWNNQKLFSANESKICIN
jgi:hypothetical protein